MDGGGETVESQLFNFLHKLFFTASVRRCAYVPLYADSLYLSLCVSLSFSGHLS